MRNRIVIGVLLGALASALTARARAEETGFSLNHFNPAEAGSDWFVLESLDLRGHARPALGIVGDYARHPLVATDAEGNVTGRLVTRQVFVHADGSLVLFDRLRFGFSLPVQLNSAGKSTNINGATYAAPASSAALGDLRLGLDARLLGVYGDPVTAAVGFQVFLPTGDAASYTGDEHVRFAPRLLVAGESGAFVYAGKLGVSLGHAQAFGGSKIGNDVLFAAAAGLRLANKKLVVGPELFGHTVVSGDVAFSKRATPLEAMLGAHYTASEQWHLGAGVSSGVTAGFGTPQVRVVALAEWAPGVQPLDRDHDTILDSEDACPLVPGVRTDSPRTNGCPPPPADRDHDGVIDPKDACVDVPGIATDDPATNGCPPPPPDRDHDGILDSDDACPDVAGVKTDDPATNGCPPDRDHDGVIDGDDACIDVPGPRRDDPKTNGCPDPDRDKDSILNEDDACPDDPGKPDPDPKRNGCPKAFVKDNQIKILDQVKFKTASALIQPSQDSEDVLNAVLGVLKAHPEIKKLHVEGHTDAHGSAAFNRKLSADRAKSVVRWLVGHGIDAASLTSEGFGPDRPIDTNATELGRKNNRRVEFHIENEAAP